MDSSDIEKVRREVVAPAIYPRRMTMDVSAHHLHSEPISASDALLRNFEPFKVGQEWGGMWDTTWFRFRASVPADWENPVAVVHLGGSDVVGFSAEGLVHDAAGTPFQGLHHRHREVALEERVWGTGVEFYVEAAANPVPRWELQDWSELRPEYDGAPLYVLERADIADADRQVQALHIEMGLLLQLAAAGTTSPERREEILRSLSQACSALDPDDIAGTVLGSRDSLAAALTRPSSS
ncbi:MAG TPA: hypothetical protein VMO88_07475, partial [Acidimicrobiales bacterium]|nr:hypothetical protein [Acidimicrobiales bacterium]